MERSRTEDLQHHGWSWKYGLIAPTVLLSAGVAGAQQPGSVEGMEQMQQGGGMHGMQCPMMGGGMGTFLGVLGVLFLLATIAALIALAVFLVRRSRPRGPVET
jgi:hypothetical protein